MPSIQKKNVTTCVVGGGSSAHVLIPLLSQMGHTVNLFTRRPEEWKDHVECDITDGITGQVSGTHKGTIHLKSSNPELVIPEADIIILCLPVHLYLPVLDQIAPFVNENKQVFVGTIFGQAGFDWMVSSSVVHYEHDRPNVVAFAIGSIPWICRTKVYGEKGINYGPKHLNVVAVTPQQHFSKLNDIFLEDISNRPLGRGKFELADSFLDLTLSVDNQILHPARCYALWQKSGGVWDSLEKVPYFYRDWDEESAQLLVKLDDEYELIRQAIRSKIPQRKFQYMLGYLELEKLNHNHKSTQVDVLSSLRDSVQLASIKTPTVEGADGKRYLDTNFRFFKDDIPFGLLIAKAIAELVQVSTPILDDVITWAQELRGEKFIEKGKINFKYCMSADYLCGIPQVYGRHTIEDLVE